MNEGRAAVPRLNLLPDDRLYLSVVFASVFDERLDGGVEIIRHFTATNYGISFPAYSSRVRVEST